MVNRFSLSFRCFGYLARCKRAVGFAKAVVVGCFLGFLAQPSNFGQRSRVFTSRLDHDNPVSSWFVGRNNQCDNP